VFPCKYRKNVDTQSYKYCTVISISSPLTIWQEFLRMLTKKILHVPPAEGTGACKGCLSKKDGDRFLQKKYAP
jgi:hypothetical protein